MHPITSTHLTSLRRQDYEATAHRHRAGRADRTPRVRSPRARSGLAFPRWFALVPAGWRSAPAGPVSC